LHAPDRLLYLPAYLFADTFALKAGIVRHAANCLLNLALHFVNASCDFILRTRLHLVFSPRTAKKIGVNSAARQNAFGFPAFDFPDLPAEARSPP
jgi:hypothetical protein